MSSADSSAPLGILKVLSDLFPVLMKWRLSCLVPTLEVAPLSAAAEGMDPSTIRDSQLCFSRCDVVEDEGYLVPFG